MRLKLQVSWFQERSSWSFVNKRRELDCILQHKAFSYLWICIEPSNSIQTATFCQLQHFESETLPFARGLPEYLFCHVITSEWRQGFGPQSPALSVFSFFVSFFFLFIPSLPLLFPPVLKFVFLHFSLPAVLHFLYIWYLHNNTGSTKWTGLGQFLTILWPNFRLWISPCKLLRQ